MLFIQICVGSSCYLKGSQEIITLLEQAVAEHRIEDEVVLSGSFCAGQCNRIGVTIQVDDEVHTGVTKEGFKEFFQEQVLAKLR